MDLNAVELISTLAQIHWATVNHISLDIGYNGSPNNSVEDSVEGTG